MKFKLVYIIQIIALLFFVWSIYNYIENLKNYFHFTNDEFSWNSIGIRNHYIVPLLLILPSIGVFLKNKIGWIFVCVYFYFMIWTFLFSPLKENLYDFENVLGMVTILLLPVSLLVIMNHKKVSQKYYKIKRENLIGINLISFVIGFCISTLLFITKNEYYLN